MDQEVLLIKKIQSGQSGEFQKLIDRYEKGCRTFFWQRCDNNLEVSRDLAQEVFIKVFQNINSLDRPEGFKAWFWTICRNVLIDYQRRENCERRTLLKQAGTPGQSPDQIAEARHTVQSAVDKLPENQKEVIELKYFWDLSLDEISQTLKTPVGTVKSRLTAARKRLLELLGQDAENE
ncbi:MAG: RNA polymerase sigma factor [Candidatus Rifleibacteriota bacterium]